MEPLWVDYIDIDTNELIGKSNGGQPNFIPKVGWLYICAQQLYVVVDVLWARRNIKVLFQKIETPNSDEFTPIAMDGEPF